MFRFLLVCYFITGFLYANSMENTFTFKRTNVDIEKKDDTQALQEAIDTHPILYLPEGDYYIDIEKIMIPNNRKIIGDNGKTKIFFNFSGKYNSRIPAAAFLLKNVLNIEISNLSFYTSGNNSVAIKITSSILTDSSLKGNIKIHDNEVKGGGLVWIGPKKGFTFNRTSEKYNNWAQGGPLLESHIMKNIIIYGNDCRGDIQFRSGMFKKATASAITLLFTQNAKIYNNKISNYRFGIWAYGGASRSKKSKKLSQNPVWCSNIEIRSNDINETYSPYWVSKCANVNMSENKSYNNQDVAVDFEGSIDSIASNNLVINSSGGALAALNGSKNITFFNNVVNTKKMNKRTNIVLIRDGNENIVYENNTFNYLQTKKNEVARVFLKNTSKNIPSNNAISFYGNKFINVVIESRGSNNLMIEENEFINPSILKTSVILKKSSAKIDNNKMLNFIYLEKKD